MSMQKIHKFIMYNNIVPIAVAVMFVGGAGAFAAQTVIQDTGLTQAAQETNTDALETLRISELDDELTIIEIVDVESGYEVTYRFNTYAAVDGVWKEVVREDVLKVRNKNRFTTDEQLRTYLNEELFEVVAQDRSFLARAQAEAEQEEEPELSLASLVGSFDVEKPADPVVDTEGNSRGIFSNAVRAVSNIITITTGPVAQNDGTGNSQKGEVSSEEQESQEPEENSDEVTDESQEDKETPGATDESATSTQDVEQESATTTETQDIEESQEVDEEEGTATTTIATDEETSENATTTESVEDDGETPETTDESATSTQDVEQESATTTETQDIEESTESQEEANPEGEQEEELGDSEQGTAGEVSEESETETEEVSSESSEEASGEGETQQTEESNDSQEEATQE